MTANEKRAQKLRIRLAKMRITHGITMKSVAKDIGYTLEHTSAVLRGKYESETLCDKLEARLNEIEKEDQYSALAA